MAEIDYSLVLVLRDEVVRRLRDKDIPAGLFDASEEDQAQTSGS